MKCKVRLWLLLLLFKIATSNGNGQSTTPRAHNLRNDPIKQVTDQLMHANMSSDITLDTRTPPKIKLLLKKNNQKAGVAENSHPGVAEPVEEDSEVLEESMKKLTFYKIEKPTTDSGLSTWILLSGQSTVSPPTKPLLNNTKLSAEKTKNATTILANPNKIAKPVFKKRPTVMPPKISATTTTTTAAPPKTTKLTRVKASLLNSKNSNHTVGNNNTIKNGTHVVRVVNATQINKTKTKSETNVALSTTEVPKKGEELIAELKNGEIDLTSVSTTVNPKKTRRPTNKKKKDKHRRRRPTAEDKSDLQNKTKVAAQKDKPLTTQIYNYLAREVMPTVGVGLVGLMVTAGLASYFLYPFGSLRRSYDIDRKDKGDSYYYDNDFGGIAEEEAIGKVIAGMPLPNNYRQRNNYPYLRHRKVDQTRFTPSPEAVQLSPSRDYSYSPSSPSSPVSKNDPVIYNKDVISQNVEASYAASDQKFVVGNIPKEAAENVTPAVVPEHGPRNLKIRKRRQVERQFDESNEIEVDDSPAKFDDDYEDSDPEKTDIADSWKPGGIRTDFARIMSNMFTLFRELLGDIRVALEMVRTKAAEFSRVLGRVQERLGSTEIKQNE